MLIGYYCCTCVIKNSILIMKMVIRKSVRNYKVVRLYNDTIIKICLLVKETVWGGKVAIKKDLGGRGVIESTEFKQADRF